MSVKFKPSEEIITFLTPIAQSVGVELVDIELKLGENPSLTVFIETKKGVDLDTLEKFHNAIDAPLDEFDPSFGAGYTLNVSSPGVDRPFKKPTDFERNIGKKVEIKLFAPIKGKKYFEGKLIAYDGNTVTIKIKEEELKLDLTRIAKINQAVIFD